MDDDDDGMVGRSMVRNLANLLLQLARERSRLIFNDGLVWGGGNGSYRMHFSNVLGTLAERTEYFTTHSV